MRPGASLRARTAAIADATDTRASAKPGALVSVASASAPTTMFGDDVRSRPGTAIRVPLTNHASDATSAATASHL